LEYLGRIDQQVKVRGYRIELGEIEAVLAQHPAVRECVVAVHEESKEQKRLVGYIVFDQERDVPASELRDFLRDKLPAYMLPQLFVTLDELPLTANGKIDRAALPAPLHIHQTAEASFVAPRTPMERELAAIWTELLGVERVGIHDNFFELGGHSLLATRIMTIVRSTFQVEIPVRLLFETPTVAALASVLEERRDAEPTTLAAEKMQAMPRGGRHVSQLLSQLGQLSEDEVKKLLQEKKLRKKRGPLNDG
jgi:acyl carrier protein